MAGYPVKMLQERGQELKLSKARVSVAFGTARLSDVLSHHEIGNPSALFPTIELGHRDGLLSPVKKWVKSSTNVPK